MTDQTLPAAPTDDEIAAMRAEIAKERAAIGALTAEKDGDPEPFDTDENPWPHETITYRGIELEVRRPSEAALIAVSMAGLPALGESGTMNVIGRFFALHFSPESLPVALTAMMDPDSGFDLSGLIQALTNA